MALVALVTWLRGSPLVRSRRARTARCCGRGSRQHQDLVVTPVKWRPLTWLITASAGLYLLAIWLIEYDREFQSAAATRLPVPVISAHVLLAVGGLAVWAL